MESSSIILCDTNIFIEIYRGNATMYQRLKEIKFENIAVSDITRGELLYGSRDKIEMQMIINDLKQFKTFPINSHISNQAIALITKYTLSYRLCLPDALIASTALYYDINLFTLNVKDFKFIDGIKFL